MLHSFHFRCAAGFLLFSTAFIFHHGTIPSIVAFVFGQGGGIPKPERVVLITIDTLRADRLDCYGYGKIRTPGVSRLARDGVLFENAVCTVPLTLPSHCSIHTGTYPIYHGIRDHSGFSLAPGTETLASRMKTLGLSTGAFVGSFVLDSRFGLGQGFDVYGDHFGSPSSSSSSENLERPADDVAQEAMRWMESQASRPFFAWIHFYDPHAPYSPPEPFKSQYARDPYDGEIAYSDSVVGKVIDFLVQKKWYQDALVILTSDHGEDLGDHGENTHGYFVYDSTIRVPLVMKLPGSRYAGKKIAAQVPSVDIFPTILQVLDAPPGRQSQGRGLLPLMVATSPRAPEDAYGETFYPYYHFGWSPLLFVRTGKFKFIDAPQPELYDLESDPKEARNIADANRVVASRLRDRMRVNYGRFGRDTAARKKEDVDPATQERLRSLGYVAYSSRASRQGIDRSLPDPKSKLAVYGLVQGALRDSQSNRLPAAIEKFKTILSREPELIDARIHLGLLYKRTGEFALAVEEFKRARQSHPSNVIAVYNLAHSYASLGKLDEAILGFKQTLQLDSKYARAHTGLGIAYQAQGSPDGAITEYKAALAIEPRDTTARNNLAGIYLGRRDPAPAIAELQRSLDSDTNRAETHNLLGSAHWLNGAPEQALAEFREAVRLRRDLVDPYLNLAMLLRSLNRTEEAIDYAKSAVSIAPRSAQAFQVLGETYRAAGMDAAAKEALARARELSKPK